jgi:protein-tyrosine phosphatase
MIDIHSHIIWDLDDGSSSVEESIAMLQAAGESGTTDIVATPHMNSEFAYQPELTAQRIQELASRIGETPKIHRGCELHLSFDNLDELLENPSAYTINGKQYLLLECPDLHVGKHAERILGQLLDVGIVPVIAHPERNPVLQRDPDRLEKWVELGCLTQVTSLSLTGTFGRSAASSCWRFLERGLAHVVASDAHDPKHRHTRMDEAREAVRARHGEEAAEMLFTETPRCIIEGLPTPGGRQNFMATERRWWQFWKPAGEID